MNKPYRPSSGTEGMGFISAWCDLCIREPLDPEAKTKCVHLSNSYLEEHNGMWFEIDGRPTCTAFKSRAEYNRTRHAKKDERQRGMF